MTYVENVHTSLHTRVTTSWARCVGGTRHSSGRNALTDRWQTGLLQAPAQGGACLSRGRCPAPSSTTPRTMRRSPRPPVPRPGPGSVVGVPAGVGISVRRELVAALAFGSPWRGYCHCYRHCYSPPRRACILCHHHCYPPLRRAPPLRRSCILWVAMSVARLVALCFSKVALSLAGSKLSLT